MNDQAKAALPGAYRAAILRDESGELWRGPLRQFYRDNDMRVATARKIHQALRRYGIATVGSGAHGDFELLLSAGGDLK